MGLKPITQGDRAVSPVEQICKAGTPIMIKSGYHPNTDTSSLCTSEQQRVCQQLLGIALWIVVCGRYDITFAVNVLSTFIALPRRGHLERVFHLIGYLQKYPERWIKIDSADHGHVPG